MLHRYLGTFQTQTHCITARSVSSNTTKARMTASCTWHRNITTIYAKMQAAHSRSAILDQITRNRDSLDDSSEWRTNVLFSIVTTTISNLLQVLMGQVRVHCSNVWYWHPSVGQGTTNPPSANFGVRHRASARPLYAAYLQYAFRM